MAHSVGTSRVNCCDAFRLDVAKVSARMATKRSPYVVTIPLMKPPQLYRRTSSGQSIFSWMQPVRARGVRDTCIAETLIDGFSPSPIPHNTEAPAASQQMKRREHTITEPGRPGTCLT